jgi:hypothetical protein
MIQVMTCINNLWSDNVNEYSEPSVSSDKPE